MGEIVGAGLVAHVPTIMLPEAVRLEINQGKEITLVTGLRRLRTEVFDRLRPDTVVVFDTHWETTFEHIATSHERRAGHFTSSELPRGMHGLPYDLPGDPELAHGLADEAAGRDDTWITATDDPYLPIYYGTVNIAAYLQGDERWVSVGICQCGESDDFLLFGQLLARAVERLDRRVVLLASGGMSHRFWPLKQLRQHESSDPVHVISPESRAADEGVLARLREGDHAAVIDGMPEYRRFGPEARFGHYLMMAGAIGGRACRAQGEQFSDYEAAVGTGQVHVWFERPEGGWTGG
jgi:3,4-dihydroxyphenylacetate 2,3-dioxygenase